jgi:RNA polymerase sigma-70 factor, ECF subfamily
VSGASRRSTDRPNAFEAGPSDVELMARLASGDVDALDELMARHWEGVVDYAARMVQCQDSATDLAQEAFIALWERRTEWETNSRPRPLLLRVVRNRSLNEVRRRAIHLRLEGQVRRMEGARRTPGPFEELKARELEGAFRQALDSLSPAKREVFILARFQGLSYAEIADVLGTSPQTVANQMSAALRALRDELRPFSPPAGVRPT